jgi:hypothetical protein
LLDAELVIADITTLNPNCFYEIGIRHMVQKPIIHMHLAGQSIPFDIAPFRSIEFSRIWPKDLEAAKQNLKEFVDEVLAEDYRVDNPVTVARGKVEFEKSATPAKILVQEQIDELALRLGQLESERPLLGPHNTNRNLHSTVAGLAMNRSPRAALADFYSGDARMEIELMATAVQVIPLMEREANDLLGRYFSSFSLSPQGGGKVIASVPIAQASSKNMNLLQKQAAERDIGVKILG